MLFRSEAGTATPPAEALAEVKDSGARFVGARDALLKNAPVGWSALQDAERVRFEAAARKAHADEVKAGKTPKPLTKADLKPSPGRWIAWFVSQVPGGVVGWLITALAGMLGAPFWFDLLNKLINIRNAGPKPESTTATKGKGK